MKYLRVFQNQKGKCKKVEILQKRVNILARLTLIEVF